MMANRILRSREWLKERGLRPSPSDSATVFDEGDLKLGNDAFECYTCDFTHDYIDINADYRN